MNKEIVYREAIESCFGFSIDGIWDFLTEKFKKKSYDERKTIFIFILKKAMNSGILKLANNGKFLDGTVDQQLFDFEKSFPKNENDISDITLSISSNYEFWAPGGGVWIDDNGEEIWT